jgi:hypothetical protein
MIRHGQAILLTSFIVYYYLQAHQNGMIYDYGLSQIAPHSSHNPQFAAERFHGYSKVTNSPA